MSWQIPIIDRTEADVEYAKANRNSAGSLKGARNAEMLNRIYNNSLYIKNIFASMGINLPNLKFRGDWAKTEFPMPNDIQKMLDDVEMLRSAFHVLHDTPRTPPMPINHYVKANDVERILFDIKRIVSTLDEDLLYSGEFYPGSSKNDQLFEEVI